MIELLNQVPQTHWPDDRLVEKCLAGDQAAWEALINKYKRLVYSIPFRYGAGESEAGDIFQLVCIDLYGDLPKLRKVESLRSWLMTVAARHSLRWKRGESRFGADETELSSHSDPLALAGPEWQAQTERVQVVREAIALLPDRCKVLLQRLFFEDPPRPYEDVARELGLATGSMGFTRGRCLDKMRKHLEELGL